VSGRSFPLDDQRTFPITSRRGFPAGGVFTDFKADEFFNEVVLLLGLNGADGATATSDESTFLNSVSFAGNAQLDTADKRFGSASVLLDGTGDHLVIPDNTNFSFVNTAFTIEGFAKMATVSSGVLIAKYGATVPVAEWFLSYTGVGLQWVHFYGAGAPDVNSFVSVVGTADFGTSDWHSWAVDQWDGDIRLYFDGLVVGSLFEVRSYPNKTSDVWVGARDHGSAQRHLDGWEDEIRVTKGVARYQGNSYAIPPNGWPRS